MEEVLYHAAAAASLNTYNGSTNAMQGERRPGIKARMGEGRSSSKGKKKKKTTTTSSSTCWVVWSGLVQLAMANASK